VRRDLGTDARVWDAKFAQVGATTHVRVVPAGPAWTVTAATHPDLSLYQSDGVHARPEGTYLAACTFFAVLFSESPVGLPVLVDVDKAAARDLQEIAWQEVSVRR